MDRFFTFNTTPIVFRYHLVPNQDSDDYSPKSQPIYDLISNLKAKLPKHNTSEPQTCRTSQILSL